MLRGQLTVYLGAFIIADIDLTFRVDIAAPPPPTPTVRPTAFHDASSSSPISPQAELTPATAIPYDKIFVSYSHQDLDIVRQFEAFGKSLGNDYLRDQWALRSGEKWDDRLLQLIDEANVFQLFWSSNSMWSKYVRWEWEYALKLGRPGFIRPTYWELPMPQSDNPRLPPEELAKLHFYGLLEESGRRRRPCIHSLRITRVAISAGIARSACFEASERSVPALRSGTFFTGTSRSKPNSPSNPTGSELCRGAAFG